VQRAFALARAKRRARIEYSREKKRARVRFWVLLGVLVFLTLCIALSIWEKITAAFGL
jgi:Tfp pilus assembly protein PilN